MKKTKSGFNIVIIVFIFCIIVLCIIGNERIVGLYILCSIPIFGPVIFNISIRKNLWFKPYFLSKYNILTSKKRFQKEFDFSKELLFHKLLEVLHDSGFKIIQTNENTGDIFAITLMSWFSFGENIYISLDELNGKTTLDFQSVYLRRYVTSDKNMINYELMREEFEKSLII